MNNSPVPRHLQTETPRGFEEVEKRDLSPEYNYCHGLANMPLSGGGGCHAALLAVANYGRAAGIPREKIAQDLRDCVNGPRKGTRKVTDREIEDTVDKAFETPREKFKPRKRLQIDGVKLLRAILERGAEFTEASLFDASPVRIDWIVQRDIIEVLQRLYDPGEYLFLGKRHEALAENVLTVSEWLKRFSRGPVPPHIIPNPLTGSIGTTKNDMPSYRADSCVKRFAFVVLEFDQMPREQQVEFWAGVKLPVVALIDSGGKSIHAWVRIDAASADEWTERVERKLFDILTPVGIDGSCKNEARLSRAPGHLRDTKRWQRVLYLAPDGRPVLP
jgi:hypothetical protein